jgi:hypothetical protein
VLWWEGCPSTPRALADVREALDSLGVSGAEVETREITTDAQAEEAGFIGSPTVLIDGVDVVPAPDGEPVALACRVYRRRDGRISPTPDPQDVRDALVAALSARS